MTVPTTVTIDGCGCCPACLIGCSGGGTAPAPAAVRAVLTWPACAGSGLPGGSVTTDLTLNAETCVYEGLAPSGLTGRPFQTHFSIGVATGSGSAGVLLGYIDPGSGVFTNGGYGADGGVFGIPPVVVWECDDGELVSGSSSFRWFDEFAFASCGTGTLAITTIP